MKVVKPFEESGLLIKKVNETIKYEAKEQKRSYLEILLGTLGATLLGILLIGNRVIKVGEATVRASNDF